MNAALRAPATIVAKVAKVPLRVVLGAPLIKDPARARRLVANLEAVKGIAKKPSALRALAKAEASNPDENLKFVVNQYSAYRNMMEGQKPLTFVYTLRFNAFDSRGRLNAERAYIAGALMGLKIRGVVHLPTRVKRFTLLKSPFKYKRAQESWEMRVHSHVVRFEADATLAEKYLKYIKTSSIPGVGIKITRTIYSPLESFYVNPYLKPSTAVGKDLQNWDVAPIVEKVVQAAEGK